MSQLDDTILDALTHVTFPKGFAQAEPAWVVTVDGVDYPLWQTDALVVGSGAAGCVQLWNLNAASKMC